MHSPHLRVTRRCLEHDLALPGDYVVRDARGFCAEHEALRAFVNKRAAAPSEGEPVRDIPPFGAYRSLHHGRTRAVTTWDEDNDVCWMVAYGATHASGEDRDCYNYFESLSGRGELAPTADDYEGLWEVSAEAVLDVLPDLGRELYAEAKARPGEEASRSFADGKAFMMVDIVVFDTGNGEEGAILLTVPQTIPHGFDVIVDYLARLLPPHVDLDTIEQAARFGGRLCRYDELAWTWVIYPPEE